MPAPRRLVTLIAAAALAAAPGSALAQGGAGDQQYQDPFGNAGSGSSSSQGATTPNVTQSAPQLSPSVGSGGSTGSSGSPAGSGTAATGPARSLPNTGVDARLLAALGLGLLLAGIGLRLRTADERF